ISRLDELAATEDLDPDVVERLRHMAEQRQLRAWERLGGGTGQGGAEVPSVTYRRLRREMLAAERGTFIRMRDERRLDDAVLAQILHELDLEEASLQRD
ncbi:Na+/H+ antiporter, partial [Spirillospora sp. NPDC049652]